MVFNATFNSISTISWRDDLQGYAYKYDLWIFWFLGDGLTYGVYIYIYLSWCDILERVVLNMISLIEGYCYNKEATEPRVPSD
jgi:hypothetical protein